MSCHLLNNVWFSGMTYAIFSPIWGYLLDKYLAPHVLFIIGCICVIIGFFLLGPFLQLNVYLVAVGLAIQGIGVSATFISTLVFMMSESVLQGAPDTEQTQGMITSLWFVSENIAGYLGSSIGNVVILCIRRKATNWIHFPALGGVTFDQMGFENSTLIVIALQVVALLAILFLCKCNQKPTTVGRSEEEMEKLLASDRNGNYRSIENHAV